MCLQEHGHFANALRNKAILMAEAMRMPITEPILWLNANEASLWDIQPGNFRMSATAQSAARLPNMIFTIFMC
jgi:hypothetical protein